MRQHKSYLCSPPNKSPRLTTYRHTHTHRGTDTYKAYFKESYGTHKHEHNENNDCKMLLRRVVYYK